jgi:hypothetical protein
MNLRKKFAWSVKNVVLDNLLQPNVDEEEEVENNPQGVEVADFADHLQLLLHQDAEEDLVVLVNLEELEELAVDLVVEIHRQEAEELVLDFHQDLKPCSTKSREKLVKLQFREVVVEGEVANHCQLERFALVPLEVPVTQSNSSLLHLVNIMNISTIYYEYIHDIF